MIKKVLPLAMLGLLCLACETNPLLPVLPIEDRSGQLDVSALGELQEVLVTQMAAGGRVRARAYMPKAGQDCRVQEARCAQDAGSTGHHVKAKVLKPGQACVFVLQVLETDSAVVVRSSSIPCGCSADAVLHVIPRAVAQLGSIWGQAEDGEQLRAHEMAAMREKLMQERRELQEARVELEKTRQELERKKADFLEPEAPPKAEPRNFTMPGALKMPEEDRIQIQGEGISAEHAEKVLRSKAAHIKDCLGRHLQRDPWLPERLVLKLKVEPSGKVAKASMGGIPKADLKRYLVTCILDKVRTWRFSAWNGSKPAWVNIPLIFKGQ